MGTLRWRIAAIYSALILGALAILTLYLLSYFQNSFLESTRTQLLRQAWVVSRMAAQELQARPDGRNLDAMAKELSQTSLGERITLIRADGLVWGDSQEDPARMDRHADRIEVREALETGQGASMRESTTLGYSLLYAAVPINLDGQAVGVARVALPLDSWAAAIGHVQRASILAGGIAALLSILVAVALARSVTAPLADLEHAAHRMAAGNLDQYVAASHPGEVGSLARAFNDMAEQLRQTIHEMSRERNQTAAVLTHLVSGLITVEPDGTVGLINPAAWRLLGRPPGEGSGRSFTAVVRDHQLVALYQACLEAGGREQERYYELGGSQRFVRAVAAGIPARQGQRVLILLEDLSELRRLETVRREFAANASHELRTPLASLRAVIETLEAGVDDPEVQREFLGRMHVDIDRLTQMTNELIELSRIESGQVPLRRRPVDPAEVAHHAAEMLRPQAERGGLTLTVEAPSGLPWVEADPDRLQSALVNLIHNAVKFTPAGGSIRVRARASDGTIAFSVTDTGPGVAPEDLPRIFERFYKADKSRAGGGTGLGLAIARHIVQAHGGRIWVESIEGKGATFNFTIPVP